MDMLIYGAYGYTGRLIAREAIAEGYRPLLAGRDALKVEALGAKLDRPARALSLENGAALRGALEDVAIVVHCAGPYVHTAGPMVEACLDTGTHYLDLTGEVKVFRALSARDEEAQEAGVMVLPGIGFDVVPSDCMGAFVAEEAGTASTLEIALFADGGVSRGTLRTLVENVDQSGLVRREGRLREVPHGWTSRTVDFGDRRRRVVSIPEGSVVTSGYSTEVPNVTTYLALPTSVRRVLRAGSSVQGLVATAPVKRLLEWLVDRQPVGPSPEERERGRTVVWAAARTGAGGMVEARLTGPDPYTFTARAAVRAAGRVVEGTAPPGYQTPATAFGVDFPLAVPGTRRQRVDGTGDRS